MGLKTSSWKSAVAYLIIICSVLRELNRTQMVVIALDFKSDLCTPDLEKKFLQQDGKCRFGGLLPVKGSCTAYIPCISFGGDLMKPLKRAECSKPDGMAFDVEYLRCRPVRKLRTCLQRECYPEESKLEDKDAWTDEILLSGVYYEEETTTLRSFPSAISIGPTYKGSNGKNNTLVTTHSSFSSSTSASKSTKSGNFQSKNTIFIFFFMQLHSIFKEYK